MTMSELPGQSGTLAAGALRSHRDQASWLAAIRTRHRLQMCAKRVSNRRVAR